MNDQPEEHPLRRQVVAEMHMRRFPALAPPARLVQIVRIVAVADRDADRAAALAMPDGVMVASASGGRHVSGETADGVHLFWESHTEASTATVILPGTVPVGFGMMPGQDRYERWLAGFPGQIIRSISLAVVPTVADAAALAQSADFSDDDLVSCDLLGGVRMWSDFRIHEDGRGRLIVSAGSLNPSDLGRLVQRLQELGNYRNLALLGLPIAQAHMPRLASLEAQLAEQAERIGDGRSADEDVLDVLSALSAELAKMAVGTNFRMDATEAYSRIALGRLEALGVRPVPGHQALTDFTERRLVPAVQTCGNFRHRVERASQLAGWITALLRARIETRIERQNSDLLSSMNRSADHQLQLQHLVEGLSVVAVSYYAIGIVAYMAKAVEKLAPSVSEELVVGVLALPIVLGVFLMLRLRMKSVAQHERSH